MHGIKSSQQACLGSPRSGRASAPAAALVGAIAITAAIIMLAILAPDVAIFHHHHNNNSAWGATEPPAYVESVTFTKHPDQSAGVDSLISGEMDVYNLRLPKSELQRVIDAGHSTYESAGGAVYQLYVNPTSDTASGFNLFADRNARYALNFIVDRVSIVENLLGSGSPMVSAIAPSYPDYLLIYRDIAALGISYNPTKAEQMITESLESAGAAKDAQGAWHHGGEPVKIIIFIRSDDVVRHQIGDDVADALEAMGMLVERTYGNLAEASDTVFSTDPADQKWHLYTYSWVRYGEPPDLDDRWLAWQYGPWKNQQPGFGVDDYWNHENDALDQLTQKLYFGEYDSPEERAHLVSQTNYYGILDAVNVFIAAGHNSYAARSDVTGVVNAPYGGITSKYTALNAQLSQNDVNLDIGNRHVVQSAWNVVGGFQDTYSFDAWNLLRDTAFVSNPHTAELLDGRNILVSAQTGGPAGKVGVPAGAIMWDHNTKTWTASDRTEATNKVTLDIVFSNWHHGQPMDINDVLYGIVFGAERRAELDDPLNVTYLVAVRVVDADTIEVYTDYEDPDGDEIARNAAMWAHVPWEVLFAMKQVVDSGQADWYREDAASKSGNWIDMLDADDSAMVRGVLAGLMEPSSAHHTPYFLYENGGSSEYVNSRYDAAISWIDARGHTAISNGPFHLSGDIVREPDGTITQIKLERFDDASYPYARGHWGAFADFEPLSGAVTIGSLAPITGSAHNYGQEVRAASDLAIAEFNEYLAHRGERWSLDATHHDTRSDPASALLALTSLNSQGIKLVNGPAIDVITDDVLEYAGDNGMIIISCCSSIPSNSIADDALFRLLPDHGVHAAKIAEFITMHAAPDATHVMPVGIDNPWATALLEESKPRLEAEGMTFADVITYVPGDVSAGAAILAERVQEMVSRQKIDASDIVVMYVGFGEGAEFFKAASAYDVLGDLRWFGANQNTASPNIRDDPAAAAFAKRVGFTVIQPSVPDYNQIVNHIHRHLFESYGIAHPSAYASYAYDAVWVLGLSILEARSSDPADVVSEVSEVAARYVGAIGSTELDENGDLKNGSYQAWLFAGADEDSGGWIKYNSSADPRAASKTTCR